MLGVDVDVDVELVIVETTGDKAKNVPIESMGGRGVFVREVQNAVLEGRADFAVHSAKDLPSVTMEELSLACIPERGDPRDALVGCSLDDLATGAVVGTGSVRRRAQLASLRPDIGFGNLRGNIETRLEKAKNFDAIVVAFAALQRLGRLDVPIDALDPGMFVPQVGQGALAAECRSDDETTNALLASVEHIESRRAVDAERAFLATLGGACDLPVGAFATVDGESIHMNALVASLDGHIVLRRQAEGTSPEELGRTLAQRLLIDDGAALVLSPLAPV